MVITYNTPKTQREAQHVACVELDVSNSLPSSNRSVEAKIYPVGYSLGESLLYVEQLMVDPMMLLIDTRLKPHSWRSDWTRSALEAKWSARYHWAGAVLGNKNYKGGPIDIVDPVKGIAGLIRYHNEGHSMILLCQCAHDGCHRFEICRLLSEAMPEVEIVPQPQVVSVQKDTIPCLSIQQPWCWLLANGFKDVENREWSTNYRGPILLHAGKTVDDEWFYSDGSINQALIARYGLEDWGMPEHKKDFATGAIVGRANLVDVITESESQWFCGTYGFVLANAAPLEPIPYRGHLKLFDVPSSVLEANPVDMPQAQIVLPEITISQPAAVEEPQPCCVCGNPVAPNVSPGGEHYCIGCYVCWKCKFPPRWVVDPVDGRNVCVCVVEMRREIERMQPKWDAARKRGRK